MVVVLLPLSVWFLPFVLESCDTCECHLRIVEQQHNGKICLPVKVTILTKLIGAYLIKTDLSTSRLAGAW